MENYQNILNGLTETDPPKKNDHIVLVDGMNMLIRSFATIKTINTNGHHVGGTIGFLKSLNYTVRMLEPTRVLVVWDGKGGSSNRKNINPEYKAQRATAKITHWGLYETVSEEKESLIANLYRAMDYLECLPIQSIMLEKLEADDIIAYIAKHTKKKVTIVSSDKDFLQLVSKNVEVYSPIIKHRYTLDNVKDKILTLPENYNIVKAFEKDSSDNLKGVKGVGIKTLIKEFPGLLEDSHFKLEDILEHSVENLDKKKIFANIVHNWDTVLKTFEIVNLHRDILDDYEKTYVKDIINSPIPELRTGHFQHLLESDRIEGITKNTETWLSNFDTLTIY